MAHSPWLTLIVPGIAAPIVLAARASVRSGAEQPGSGGGETRQGRSGLSRVWRHPEGRWPLLVRLAGRGSLALRWDRGEPQADLRPWQRGLLSALDLPPELFPSAPVSAAGRVGTAANEVGGERGGTWLHAEPVHFAAGLSRLTFLGLEGLARVTSAERDALRPLLTEHLQASGLDLAASCDWLIHSPRPLSVHTSCPDAAAANELERVMPRGADSGMLRRLMTELQMLLHEHPVNLARARRGLPAINSVWLWGAGSASLRPAVLNLPIAMGQAAFLRGLYQLQAQSAQPLPGEGEALLAALAAVPRAIAVIERGNLVSEEAGSAGHSGLSSDSGFSSDRSFNSDTATGNGRAGAGAAPTSTRRVAAAASLATDELAELDALERRWLAPLTRALAAGQLARLDLVLDGWHCDITRAALKRFWRKSLPLARWPAVATSVVTQ